MGRHPKPFTISDVSRTRGVAKTRMCDVYRMALLSHIPSSSKCETQLNSSAASDVTDDRCHGSDLHPDLCWRGPRPHP
jgi:hypothetical protein